jgi:hypothetical protein
MHALPACWVLDAWFLGTLAGALVALGALGCWMLNRVSVEVGNVGELQAVCLSSSILFLAGWRRRTKLFQTPCRAVGWEGEGRGSFGTLWVFARPGM